MCLVTGVFCGLRKVLLWDRQGPQTPCLWPILSSLCSNTTPQMWPRWSDGTVGLFVVHCWEVFKSQTLYDEFWINLSFGRPLRSGALLEWWTDCVGLHLKSEWMCCSSPQTPSFLSFPSDSCLIFPLRMTNLPPPVNCVLASIKTAGLSAGNVTADDPASTDFTERRDRWRSQSLSSLCVLKQGRGRRWDSTWSSPARRRCRGRVPVAMDRVQMKRSKMTHAKLSHLC